ncbi:MAG: hypothetical protein Aurels2KO_50860 [Aureliella sp.]
MLKETRVPIKATKKHARRVDYKYERNGTASILVFAEPLAGYRQATARPQRTKVDWAIEVANLLDTRFANCEWITLVLDNLNTHTKGAFYDAFPPEQARAYLRRIEFCFTPKHWSWLNIATCELSCMTSLCLHGGELESSTSFNPRSKRGPKSQNIKQRGIDWQLKIDDARQKLKRLCPRIKG